MNLKKQEIVEDDKIAPAIEILKEMLRRAEDSRKKEAEVKAAEAHTAPLGSHVVETMPETIYVSIDGDNIGNSVAQAEMKDDEQAIKEMSDRINMGQQVLTAWAQQFGGSVIEAGGDEGLVKVPGKASDHIDELRSKYKDAVGATCTVGVGKSISESTKARMLGKLRGKNRTVVYDNGTEKELKLRTEQKGEESPADKLRAAGLVPGAEKETPKYGLSQDMIEHRKKEHQDYRKWKVDNGHMQEGDHDVEFVDNPDEFEMEGHVPEEGTPAQAGQEAQQAQVAQQEQPTEPAQAEQQAPEQEAPQQEQTPAEPSEPAQPVQQEPSKEIQPVQSSEEDKEEPKKKPKRFGNYAHDPEIESEDFSDRDNPEFAKRLWYAMKYGPQ